jgi:hypothetical protein
LPVKNLALTSRRMATLAAASLFVMPAKAGIQGNQRGLAALDSLFRGCEEIGFDWSLFAMRFHWDSVSIPKRLANKRFPHSLFRGNDGRK